MTSEVSIGKPEEVPNAVVPDILPECILILDPEHIMVVGESSIACNVKVNIKTGATELIGNNIYQGTLL